MTSPSLRAGTTAWTSGAAMPGRRWSARRSARRIPKLPRATTSPDPRCSREPCRGSRKREHRDRVLRTRHGAPRSRARDGALRRATDALFRKQQPDGYWWAELESNVTITAEVLLLHRVWGTFERVPQSAGRSATSGAQQRAHGGWELAYDDGGELSVIGRGVPGAAACSACRADDPALVRARDVHPRARRHLEVRASSRRCTSRWSVRTTGPASRRCRRC